MGGTIARYAAEGNEILMAVCMVPNEVERRNGEIAHAAELLGAKAIVQNLDLDHKILTREIVGIFDGLIGDFGPDVIFTHWNHDSHQDHRIISEAVFSAARRNDCDLYMYEQIIPGGITPYGFRAQRLVDITDRIDKKLASLKAHESQLRRFSLDWVEGVKGRASQWGFMISVKYAEAFEVVKIIEKAGKPSSGRRVEPAGAARRLENRKAERVHSAVSGPEKTEEVEVFAGRDSAE
jgi:LmbE family N-acetylglucosaminyl deacetylase